MVQLMALDRKFTYKDRQKLENLLAGSAVSGSRLEGIYVPSNKQNSAPSTDDHILECTNLPNISERRQTSRCQNDGMKQLSYSGPTIIWRSRKKYIRHGDLEPRKLCTPIFYVDSTLFQLGNLL